MAKNRDRSKHGSDGRFTGSFPLEGKYPRWLNLDDTATSVPIDDAPPFIRLSASVERAWDAYKASLEEEPEPVAIYVGDVPFNDDDYLDATDPTTPRRRLRALAKSESIRVRLGVARNPAAALSLLRKMLREEKSPGIRQALSEEIDLRTDEEGGVGND